jgi:hypothetical protein
MKIPVIKKLVETMNLSALRAAEEAILEERNPESTIPGDDEGEQLTHVLAAIEILKSMEKGDTFQEALRGYSQRVRKSIS